MLEYSWKYIKEKYKKLSFEKSIFKDRDIVLFGVGMQVAEAIEIFKTGNKRLYLTDNNPELWGKKVSGILVISPSEIPTLEAPFIIVTTATRNYASIFKQLEDLKINYISLFRYIFAKEVEAFNKINEGFLYDKESKKVWLGVLYAKLTGNMEILRDLYSENQYYAIPEFNKISNENIMVDCGAYVGDSLECFIYKNCGILRKIYAFEPGRRQFNALKFRCNRLINEWALDEGQIVLENLGVGEKTLKQVELNFADATASRNSNIGFDMQTIDMISLDNYFSDLNERITYIKADIEGFEMEMLKGAQNIIKKYKPNLAICVYHKPLDLIKIPEYIKSLVPEYRMSLRHHSVLDEETVLYCYL